MFSHVTIGTNDLRRATDFYNVLLGPLGLIQRPVTPDDGPPSSCWIYPEQQLPRFYVYAPFDRCAASAGNGSMVAFLADSPDAVDVAYAAAMEAGATSEGSPGYRPQYGNGYYGAYIRDPDGNKIHVVFRGDLADSVSQSRA